MANFIMVQNDYHNTRSKFDVVERVTAERINRFRRKLCPNVDCECGCDILGGLGWSTRTSDYRDLLRRAERFVRLGVAK